MCFFHENLFSFTENDFFSRKILNTHLYRLKGPPTGSSFAHVQGVHSADGGDLKFKIKIQK